MAYAGVKQSPTVERAPKGPRRVREDIQFLRALAVVSVIVYHVHERWLPGGFVGVDVFFVISGYLICGALARELVDGGRIRLWAFYARRVRRILPMSFVVIATTLVATLFVASPIRMLVWGQPWRESSIVKDGLAALAYVPNFWFGFQQSDYLAERAPTPFLHYWSLGVEEQFYVVAPLLLVLAWILARHNLKRFALGVAIVVAGSFAYGVWLTDRDSISGFYNPGARAWELGIGALAALVGLVGWAPRGSKFVTVSRWVAAAVLGAALVGGDFGFAWPGWIALVPVVAAATLLSTGTRGMADTSRGWWTWRVFQRLGDWSYSLYLWHWPALVLVAMGIGRPLRIREAAVVILIVVALSAATYRYIELPFRRKPVDTRGRKARMFAGAAVGSLVVLVVAGLVGVLGNRLVSAGSAAPSAAPTAMSLVPSTADFAQQLPVFLSPTLVDAKSDIPRVYGDGCHLWVGDYTIPETCTFGTGSRPVIAVMGDSHAAQWVEPLALAADRGEITLVSLTSSGCAPFPLPYSESAGRSAADCQRWREAALAKVRAVQPDTLILSATFFAGLESGTDRASAYASGVAEFLATVPVGTRVAYISDTARMSADPVECAAAHRNDLGSCGRTRVDATRPEVAQAIRVAVESAGGEFFDPVPYMCSDTECGIVVGDILIYRDNDHITKTFSLRLDSFVRQIAGLN